MRQPKPPEIKIFLAILPLLNPAPFDQKLATGLFISLSVFGATNFFCLTAPLFPRKLWPLSLVLFAAAVFQALSYFVNVPALWVASFFLLFDWNDVDRNRLGPKSLPLLLRLAGFIGGVFLVGLGQEILGSRAGMAIFEQPAGFLALLALYAWGFNGAFDGARPLLRGPGPVKKIGRPT